MVVVDLRVAGVDFGDGSSRFWGSIVDCMYPMHLILSSLHYVIFTMYFHFLLYFAFGIKLN